ncbi:hypothetical protein Aduo_012352 [Ancylostoma duodenale]
MAALTVVEEKQPPANTNAAVELDRNKERRNALDARRDQGGPRLPPAGSEVSLPIPIPRESLVCQECQGGVIKVAEVTK